MRLPALFKIFWVHFVAFPLFGIYKALALQCEATGETCTVLLAYVVLEPIHGACKVFGNHRWGATAAEYSMTLQRKANEARNDRIREFGIMRLHRWATFIAQHTRGDVFTVVAGYSPKRAELDISLHLGDVCAYSPGVATVRYMLVRARAGFVGLAAYIDDRVSCP